MKKFILLFFFLIGSSLFAQTLLLEENFNYSAGALLTANGWTAHSGGGTAAIDVVAGLTFANYFASGIGGAAAVDNTGEDDNKAFVAQTSGSVYSAFLVKVSSISSGYFFHLGPNPTGTTFRGRIFMQANGANVQFGVAVGSGATTYSATNYSTGTTYLLVLKYEIVGGATNDKVSLYVFTAGDDFSTEPGAAAVGPLTDAAQSDINPGSVALRQYSATQNVTIDGIRVATSWANLISAPSPVATAATGVLSTSFSANWNTVSEASKYYLDVSTDNFTTYVAGYNNLDVGNVTTYSVTGLSAGSTYSYRVRAYNSTGGTGPNSNTISVTTIQLVLAAIEAGALSFTEGDPAIAITGTTTVTSSEANLDGGVVQITGNYQNGQDVLSFVDANGITGTWDAATGKITLSGTSTTANYQTAIRSIKYQNTSLNPGTAQRTVSFTLSIGSFNGNTVTRSISIAAINNAPVLAGIEGAAISYTAGPVQQITNSTTIADVDNTIIASAIIQITGNYANGQDLLLFTNQNGITGTWTSATGSISLTGTATLANYQSALRSVRFQNTSLNASPLVRTISFTVNDGAANSNTVTRNINVNNAPVISSIETAQLSYAPGAAATPITGTLALTDVDNANLAGAVISMVGYYEWGKDVLSFTNANGITGVWNAASGVMTLSGASSVANYQTALRSITYQNISPTPVRLIRIISFIVNDGISNSNVSSREINLGFTAPSLGGIEGDSFTYKQGDGEKIITTGITISSPSSPMINSATVQITGNYRNGEDVLSCSSQNQIIAVWNSAEGKIDLSWPSAVLNYQTALRSVTYKNVSNNPSKLPRTVSFAVSDGYSSSNAVTRIINVSVFTNLILTSNISDGGTVAGGGTFFSGNPVTVTATPSTGYAFVNWTEGGVAVSANASYTFTMNDNRNLVANFALIKYNVAASSNTEAGGTVSGGGAFDYGTSVTVTAATKPGYDFSNWSEGAVFLSTSPNYTFVVTGNRNLVATFTKIRVLSVTPEIVNAAFSSGTSNITVTNSGGGTMNWSAVSNVFWITITGGASGINDGTIKINYSPNNSISRIGTITITSDGVSGSPKTVEIRQAGRITGVEDLGLGIPETYLVEQNYPNPFNPTTILRYGLPKESNVNVTVYNLLGEEIAKLFDGIQGAGFHEINFNAANLPSGIYIYKISAGNFTQIKKMLLMK